MKLKIALIASILFSTAGCSITYPAYGTVEKTKETFSGTAKSTMTSGVLKVTTAEGIKCNGSYVPPIVSSYKEVASMSGNIICDDGRLGTWSATGSILEGFRGIGKIDGNAFSFYAGNAI